MLHLHQLNVVQNSRHQLRACILHEVGKGYPIQHGGGQRISYSTWRCKVLPAFHSFSQVIFLPSFPRCQQGFFWHGFSPVQATRWSALLFEPLLARGIKETSFRLACLLARHSAVAISPYHCPWAWAHRSEESGSYFLLLFWMRGRGEPGFHSQGTTGSQAVCRQHNRLSFPRHCI